MNDSTRLQKLIALVFAAIIAAAALFTGLSVIGLIGPDEPRYAWIARAMAQTHDWITPRLYGQPWFEKPVLYYWAAGIGFKLLHSPEWAARIPSAIAAFIAAPAIAWLALKHYGEKTAWLALAIFPTTVAAVAFARAATPDMLFATALTLAMASASAVLRAQNSPPARDSTSPAKTAGAHWPLIFFGAALGVATLAKGPAAVILAGGSIALWSIATRQWKTAFHFAHPVALLSFAIVAIPWYALCAIRNPGFLRTFLWLHNVERYVTPVFQHKQPFWFFGPIVLIAMLPWTLLLGLAAADGLRLWREKRWHNSPAFFFACWGFFPIAFFSLSQSKLPSYILPAIPAICLCIAISLARRLEDKGELVGILLMPVATALALLTVTVIRRLSAANPAASETFGSTIIAIEIILAIAAMVAAWSPKRRLYAVAFSSLSAAVLVASVPRLPLSSAIPTTRELAERLAPASSAGHLYLFDADRSCIFGLQFYLEREIPQWTTAVATESSVVTTRNAVHTLNEQANITTLDQLQSNCIIAEVASPKPAQGK